MSCDTIKNMHMLGLITIAKHFCIESSIKLQKIPKTNPPCDEICILSGFGPNT